MKVRPPHRQTDLDFQLPTTECETCPVKNHTHKKNEVLKNVHRVF